MSTRALFLRCLAVIYLIAFISLLPQIDGLVGSNGVLPEHDLLESIHAAYGARAYALLPTLAWVSSSDAFLRSMAWAGIVCAVLLFLGLVPLPAAIGLYVLYLSIVAVGQDFFAFQWDALLLETGFAAILIAPPHLRSSYDEPPPWIAVWVFRVLLFRLMFESGVVKLLSGDPTWRNLTALTYHYHTQPLPAPAAWYADKLPLIVQKPSVLGVFAIELFVPFLFFATRRLRVVAAFLTIALQLMIAATGNYAFFNLLTILLCVFLPDVKPAPGRGHWIVRTAAVVLIVIGVLQAAGMLGLPDPLASIERRAQTFQVVNRYGLFAVMTTSRREIIIEGSDDGANWRPYEFKYKPGDVHRPLPWVAPYQPRLDWQMWFAALSNYQDQPWFQQFMIRLLQGRREVVALLAINPFPDRPPRFVRALAYDYRFTDRAARRQTGAIWMRTEAGDYFPAVSLKQ